MSHLPITDIPKRSGILLSASSMPGTVLGPSDAMGNKTDKVAGRIELRC